MEMASTTPASQTIAVDAPPGGQPGRQGGGQEPRLDADVNKTRPMLPVTGGDRRRYVPGLVGFLLAVGISVALAVIIAWGPIGRPTVGLLVIALSVSLMMSGVHIGPAMALPSLLGLWRLGGESVVVYALESIPHSSAASWSLSVIPMFVLMGLVLFQTGLASVIFDAARQVIGRVPGGLAVATIFAGAGMSAASGSTLGVTYAVSRIGIPEMMKAGYSPRLATGTVAMAGVLKMLIPPSITVVIYAGIAETPIGPQLLAGLVPGLLLAVLFAVMIVIRAKLNPTLAPAVDTSGFTVRAKAIAVARGWPVLLLITIVVGGMYSGVTTATESGALAAFAAIVIGVGSNRRNGARANAKLLAVALAQTVSAVAAIMVLLISVKMLTTLAALSGLVQELSSFVVDLGLSRTGFLLILVLLYVIMGALMDELAMMLLTVPILLPVLDQMDIDKIWFGVFLILLCEVGMVIPPVGFLSFVVAGIAQRPEVNLGRRVTLVDVFRGVLPYVVVALGLVIFLIFVPELALWLPNLSSN